MSAILHHAPVELDETKIHCSLIWHVERLQGSIWHHYYRDSGAFQILVVSVYGCYSQDVSSDSNARVSD